MQMRPACYNHPNREAVVLCQRCHKPICTECMNEAPVGFQCPSCVAEGLKATRQHEGRYGGLRERNPGVASKALIGINVVMFVVILITGGIWSLFGRMVALTPQATCGLAADPNSYMLASKEQCLAMAGTIWYPGISSGAFWQVITTAFTHVEIWHIGFNMLALWILGPALESALGRSRFMAIYLVSAVTASTLVVWFSNPVTPTIGASGSIFGLMGAILVVALKNKGDVKGILVWLGINVAITFLYANISWQGHLGGFIGGFLVAALFVHAPRSNRTLIQWSGTALVVTVCVVLIVVRALQLAT